MQIIIVGCGKEGITIIKELTKEGHDVAAIDINGRVVENISNTHDVLGVVGNGASYSVQLEAGIESADLLIALTGSDEVNLLCCLIAKKAGNCSTIARVRNPVYNAELDFIKEELGLSMTVNPELAAATEISRILRFPFAIKIETFAKGRIELLKFKVKEGSLLDHCTLFDIQKKTQCDVLIGAVEREDEVIIPNGRFELRAKDIITIVASPKNASSFFKKVKFDTHQVKSTMILGGGKIAFYLAIQLLHMGISVKIIEKSYERCNFLTENLPHATIIYGDASNQELLLEEGLEYEEAVVSLTDLDEENIVLSLFAGKRSNAKIVTKMNRITFDDVIREFDLGSVIHPKNITAEYITQYVRARQNSIGSNIETLYKIIENRAEALEFLIREDAQVVGIPLEKLDLEENLLIACINKKGRIIIPRGKDIIEVGDTVIVVTTNTGYHDIKDILKTY